MGSFEDFFFNHFYFEIWDSILKKFLFIILIFKFEIEILFSWTSFEFFFSSFKIRNFLEIGTIYFWKFMESFFFFHHSSSFKKKKNKFFFWWVDSATHGVLIGGGGILAPFLCHHHFYFFSTSSSSLSLLAPLPLFTTFFLLHFLHFYTISCLENHFSRLPNLMFSISQNIFSNPWVLDHLCDYSLASFFYIFFISAPFLAKKITSLGFQTRFLPSLKIFFSDPWVLDHLWKTLFFFWNPFSNLHLCISMASSHGPTFLTFNGKKYHPSLEWNDEEGLLQDLNSQLHTHPKRISRWAHFLLFFCCW